MTAPAAIQSTRFEGRQLITEFGFKSGARRIIATFDEGYRDCTVQVIHGKESGKGMKWKSFDGRMQDILSITATSTSCAVRDGNSLPES
jgi:hypothetical protein